MSAKKLKEKTTSQISCASTASKGQESDDTDTSADSTKLKLGGRDLSHQ